MRTTYYNLLEHPTLLEKGQLIAILGTSTLFSTNYMKYFYPTYSQLAHFYSVRKEKAKGKPLSLQTRGSRDPCWLEWCGSRSDHLMGRGHTQQASWPQPHSWIISPTVPANTQCTEPTPTHLQVLQEKGIFG